MGSGLKKKGNYKGLNTGFSPSKEQTKWMRYCVDNDIRISPVPTQKGMQPEEWRIDVRLGPYKKGEKNFLSPNVYTADIIHQELYNMMKYYYDKRSR
jgi:hypothetical protein